MVLLLQVEALTVPAPDRPFLPESTQQIVLDSRQLPNVGKRRCMQDTVWKSPRSLVTCDEFPSHVRTAAVKTLYILHRRKHKQLRSNHPFRLVLPGRRGPKFQGLKMGGEGCALRQPSPEDLDGIGRGDCWELSLLVLRALATLAVRCESSRHYRRKIAIPWNIEQGEWTWSSINGILLHPLASYWNYIRACAAVCYHIYYKRGTHSFGWRTRNAPWSAEESSSWWRVSCRPR